MSQGHISALESKHAELEHRIEQEEARPVPDNVALYDLKRRKLALKDELAAFSPQ